MLRPHVVTHHNLLKESSNVMRINFATALLLDGNLSGCLLILDEMDAEKDPAVQQLRAAINNWRRGLSIWQKLMLFCGDKPKAPVQLDYLPGHLE